MDFGLIRQAWSDRARNLGLNMHFQLAPFLPLAYQIELTEFLFQSHSHQYENVSQMLMLYFHRSQEGSPSSVFCFHQLIPCSLHLLFKHFLPNGSHRLAEQHMLLASSGVPGLIVLPH